MKYVQLSRDYELLNRVVNDPSVFPYLSLGLEGHLDTSFLVNDPANLFFANEYGGFLLLNQGDGVYEIHSQFLPEGRNRRAVFGAVEAMAHMFTETDCTKLITDCPHGNDRALALAEGVGMKKTGERVLVNTVCDVYEITKEGWEQRCR